TFMIGPPTFFVGLMDAPGFEPRRVRSLRLISSGGAGVTPAFVEQATDTFGARVKRTYGSTEAPTVTTSTPQDPVQRARETDGHGRAAGERSRDRAGAAGRRSRRAVAAGTGAVRWLRRPRPDARCDPPGLVPHRRPRHRRRRRLAHDRRPHEGRHHPRRREHR